jgi:cytoskeletal protein RodZ
MKKIKELGIGKVFSKIKKLRLPFRIVGIVLILAIGLIIWQPSIVRGEFDIQAIFDRLTQHDQKIEDLEKKAEDTRKQGTQAPVQTTSDTLRKQGTQAPVQTTSDTLTTTAPVVTSPSSTAPTNETSVFTPTPTVTIDNTAYLQECTDKYNARLAALTPIQQQINQKTQELADLPATMYARAANSLMTNAQVTRQIADQTTILINQLSNLRSQLATLSRQYPTCYDN